MVLLHDHVVKDLLVMQTMMKTGRSYQDLGADYFQARHQEEYKRAHIRGLQRLGYEVTLTQAA